MNYADYLRTKEIRTNSAGFDVDKKTLNLMMIEFQKAVALWAIKKGRSAVFADCGLGKTIIQLEWSKIVNETINKPALILAPLAVSKQTKRESEKFNFSSINICSTQSDVKKGINITNYEKMHLFDFDSFGSIVLDESGILKSYTGKYKKELIKKSKNIKYKLACTATPAPNDMMEIGNHSEFLDVMNSNEMLARWFILDTMDLGKYRLKKHAIKSFWTWVASWACCFSMPSDLGFSNKGFILPPLKYKNIVVKSVQKLKPGQLFALQEKISATNLHKELRLSLSYRVKEAQKLVKSRPDENWIIWCNTNYEADELKKAIPDAIEVRGSDKDAVKERKLIDFTNGIEKKIITKPSIAGFGLNWQHCHNVIFVGLSYSYEMLYQAVRRSWRFGQEKPVNVYLIQSENEKTIAETVQRKANEHIEMQRQMSKVNFISIDSKSSKVRSFTDATEETIYPIWL